MAEEPGGRQSPPAPVVAVYGLCGLVIVPWFLLYFSDIIVRGLPELGYTAGFALDVTTHDDDRRRWEFDREDMRNGAWTKIEANEPLPFEGSPTCSAVSSWQNINHSSRDPEIVAREAS